MKWRLCAAVAALSLLLSGCSSLLARSYTSVTPHSATPPAEGDSSILRVENYQELVNALIYLISLGEEEGTVRMYNYDQDVEQSLSNACLEVVQEDPLGAYSVDFIRYDVTPIVSYYEAAVEITYRRTREQVSAIVAATGATAIRSQLKDLLSSFGTEAALRISYFEGDETYIQTLFREAYYASPDTALDLPEAQVYIYPKGRRAAASASWRSCLPTTWSRKSSSAAGLPWPGAPMRSWSPSGGPRGTRPSRPYLPPCWTPDTTIRRGGPALMTPWWRGQQTARDLPWPPCCWPNGWS